MITRTFLGQVLVIVTIHAAAIHRKAELDSSQHSTTSDNRYWSDAVVDSLRPSFSPQDEAEFFDRIANQRVVDLQRGCGRVKNRLVVFEDGTKACVRYRENQHGLRGELYAYQLSKLLDTWNVPPAFLVRLNLSSPMWKGVADGVAKAEWRNGKSVILTLYVDDLQPEYLPEELKSTDKLITSSLLEGMSQDDQVQLAQWSDLIIFDYVVGHSDRLFSSLFNMQWTPDMLDRAIHNVAKSSTGSLVMFDNESTFWLGYNTAEKEKYKAMQSLFLQKLCTFRKSVIDKIRELSTDPDPTSQLVQSLQASNAVAVRELGPIPGKYAKEFRSRMEDVLSRIEQCSGEEPSS